MLGGAFDRVITDRDQPLMRSRSSITLLSYRGKPYAVGSVNGQGKILKQEVRPAFSRTSTSLTATKMFSSNHHGWFQQDGARAWCTHIKGHNQLNTTLDSTFHRESSLQISICQICL